MATPREHIREIRKEKFSIGAETLNPLRNDLHHSVKIFSAELYAKDVHFLMELIQNAEDNEYPEEVDPSLEFVVTSRDITGTGASSTLLVFNNEKGFSPKNISSICSVGSSTKKGNRKSGYIGEKGIGFKSVFLISSKPYIFSNGYHIRFSDEPCPHCKIGYIVPEWVDDASILSNLQLVYGSASRLPATALVLPLKPEKVAPVKQQLSSIQSEALLFLSKIKRLSVREDNKEPRASTVSAIAIASETNFITRKNIDAESYTVHLSAGKKVGDFDSECRYHMWRQKFPVKPEHTDEKRTEVGELSITLAFPFDERLKRGATSPGLYAYLPTEMFTNFPFIIQADFLLASSRETILFDNKWNKGILGCVPVAFINAFKSLVLETKNAPVFNLPNMFRFLPINKSCYSQLNVVRDTIKAMLLVEDIIPCKLYKDQRFFGSPSKVKRLMPSFWNILIKAQKQGIYLHNLFSHETKIMSRSFDIRVSDDVLIFLGIQFVSSEWYATCIRSSNLVCRLSEDVYVELLAFLAVNWISKFQKTSVTRMPLMKYVDLNSKVSFCSINEAVAVGGRTRLFMCGHPSSMSWLIDWSREFKHVSACFCLPKATQEAISSCSQRQTLHWWLSYTVKVTFYTVLGYATDISFAVSMDWKLAIAYSHFLYHSYVKGYLGEHEVSGLSCKMPIVDVHGNVHIQRNGVVLPRKGSKWAELFDFNPWKVQGYVELNVDYLQPGNFGGMCTSGGELIHFISRFVVALDIPRLPLPDAVIPTFSSHLTKQNALELLGWIYTQGHDKIPEKFLLCVKQGSWLRVSLNKSPAYKPPSQTFVSSSQWGNLLLDGSVLVDIPLIDEEFYDFQIFQYRAELHKIGVRFEFGEACQYIGKCLMKMAASSSLSKSSVFSILNFIRFSRSKMIPADDFINSIKEGQWLRTPKGDKVPKAAVLFDQGWSVAKQISDIPFINEDYYGEEIHSYKDELKLLGVVVGFNENYQLVIDNLKSPSCLNPFSADVFLLLLQCICHSGSSNNIVEVLQKKKCLKTNDGYMFPGECFLFNPEWGCLLQVFDGFPLVDEGFYGSHIVSFKNELKKIGVVIDFEDASLRLASCFKQQASSSSIGKQHVLSFLACCRKLKGKYAFPEDVMKCINAVQWLRTRNGQYRCPEGCILSGPDWGFISPFTVLPFIDDKYYGEDIHEYREQLESFGVTIDLKDGLDFVAKSLCFPPDPTSIAPVSVLSLLECIRMLRPRWATSTPDDFLARVSKEWVKTQFGYVTPNKALLFSEEWTGFLQQTDGPFIDEDFYGSSISSYRLELHAIGVTVDVEKGCQLLTNSLNAHRDFTTIERIYNYLNEFKWKPDQKAEKNIWIPKGRDNGEWVGPDDCVVHDEDGLFSTHLNILDAHYDNKLRGFFTRAFEVPSKPSLGDYLSLWKEWEGSGDQQLSVAQCHAFWIRVAGSWESLSSTQKKSVVETLTKLPTDSVSRQKIWLGDKKDVFLADDLHLKELFASSYPRPMFVWQPLADLPSLSHSKLLDVYSQIGVRCISDAVRVEDLSLLPNVELKQTKGLLNKELFSLILGFLSNPSVGMQAERRHEIVRRLLGITVSETAEPIPVSYSLTLSSGMVIRLKDSQPLRLDKESSKLFVQKIDMGRKRSAMEFATHFSETISSALLWDEEDLMGVLCELIKVASLVEFNREALGFLMRSKNLQVYKEDKEFLKSAFPSPRKRRKRQW